MKKISSLFILSLIVMSSTAFAGELDGLYVGDVLSDHGESEALENVVATLKSLDDYYALTVIDASDVLVEPAEINASLVKRDQETGKVIFTAEDGEKLTLNEEASRNGLLVLDTTADDNSPVRITFRRKK